ncbi:MAG: medium chain dehydrogenase/reductase family protein [Actinomycetota bacterium]
MAYRRAIITQFGGPEVLRVVEEATLPEPEPGEVRIRVLAAGVAFTDTMIRQGSYPDVKEEPPFTPGYDMVGVVDALGDGVTTLAVGQMVAELTVIGAYSEYICLDAERLVPVPDGVDPAEAVSMILTYVTAYQMLHRKAMIENGQRILVHGAVGTALLQLGGLLDLEMYGTASEAKAGHVAALGATRIDYRHEDFVARIDELTDDGVDAVFDGIGPETFRRSFRTLRPGGTLVIFGTAASDLSSMRAKIGLAFAALGLLVRRYLSRTRTVTGYSIAPRRRDHPEMFHEDLTALFKLVASRKIVPVIGRRVTLDEIVEAHELIDAFAVEGKIVLTFD